MTLEPAFFIGILNNITLLLALGFLYSLCIRRWETGTVKGKLVAGFLFGCVAMLGMLFPLQYSPGVFFDGRTILLGIIGLFGGWISASVAVLMTGILRIWQGGAGQWAGLSTILSAAYLGVLFRILRRRYSWSNGFSFLYSFGIIVHLAMLACMLILPDPIRWSVLLEISIPVLLVYPVATMLYGRMIIELQESTLAAATLLESEEKYRRIIETASEGILSLDSNARITFINPQMASMLGYTVEEMLGKTVESFLPEDQLQDHHLQMEFLMQGNDAIYERCFMRKDGVEHWTLISARAISNSEGKYDGFFAMVTDITKRKLAEAELLSSASQLRTLVETIPDLIWLKNAEGVYLACNPMFERFFGAKEADIVGKTDYYFVDRKLADFFRENDRKAMAAGKPSVNEEWLTFADDGHRALVETIKTPMYGAGGTLIGVLGISRDITERVRREQAEYQQATHDELTGLYNLRGYCAAVAKILPAGSGGAVLLVGIDDFKLINDVYGLAFGDKYLAAFGEYLRENFSETAVVARFGGDEFMLFFAGPDGLIGATSASKLMEVIFLETEIGTFVVHLSGGISVLTKQEPKLELQVQRAYLAMHHAKESGKWCVKTYEPVLQDKVSRRFAIREALNQALANEEFTLVYQPIFDIQETVVKIIGYETLLRWTSQKLGVVSPAEFVPVAEETNLILPIGKWALREACRFSANIGKLFGEPVNVAVNISMLQMAMPNFVNMVKEILLETGLPARNLSLEVTESILMTDAATKISYLQALHDFGVSISLDDFGTGYSSFTYLTQMPITTLKIDKSMVDEITGCCNSKSLLLLESLMQLSALLGYRVVAEGVETQEQLDFLKSKGCGYCQGYLLGRPLSKDAVLSKYGEKPDLEGPH